MFITINFPFADFRSLHSEMGGRLDRPAWGASDSRASFARGFGSIHTRTKSGNRFVGENYYADCQNLIKYPELNFIEPLSNDKRRVLAYPTYRRFFFDGIFAGRFELGFRLNEASIKEIQALAVARKETVQFDPVAIARQLIETELSLHLLDGRVIGRRVKNAMDHLRDGYLLSSTKGNALKQFDLVEFGPKYVGVGAPFVVMRTTPDTPIHRPKRTRTLVSRKEVEAFSISSGAHQQAFDTLMIKSVRGLDDETPQERLIRLMFTQLRALCFAHKFYLDGHDKGNFPKSEKLKEAVAAMLFRIKELSPLEDDVRDAEVCATMKDLISNSDVNLALLASEITSHLKKNLLEKTLWYILRVLDKKSDVAIEAAATAATQKLLGSGS